MAQHINQGSIAKCLSAVSIFVSGIAAILPTPADRYAFALAVALANVGVYLGAKRDEIEQAKSGA